MPFDRSSILTFTVPGDTDVIAMVDAAVIAAVKVGLTAREQTVLDSYQWTPTQVQLEGDPLATPPIAPIVSTWAGNDPPPLYYKTTAAKMRTALARYWREYGMAAQ